jgi:hypothetical protein
MISRLFVLRIHDPAVPVKMSTRGAYIGDGYMFKLFSSRKSGNRVLIVLLYAQAFRLGRRQYINKFFTFVLESGKNALQVFFCVM